MPYFYHFKLVFVLPFYVFFSNIVTSKQKKPKKYRVQANELQLAPATAQTSCDVRDVTMQCES